MLSSVKLPGKHVGDVTVTWQTSTIEKLQGTLIGEVLLTLFGGRQGVKEKGRRERKMGRREAEREGGEESGGGEA